ncbi:MAG: hypothetical protein DWP95_04240 [Proteobacteria bacterium]|nr:MAG: hypothetical protein DWP95_04240 [Pseudomonadota bacterium]
MNHLSAKTRHLLLVTLLFSAFAVNALTLNPLIEAPDGHTIINQEPLLYNDQIIFITKQDSGYSLWSFDLSNHNYTMLQDFDQFNPSQNFHIIDGYFYFRDNNEPSLIWRSDGTPDGTSPVPGLITFRDSYLQPQNNLLFAQWAGENSDIVGFDGSNYRSYGVQHFPYEKAVCAFSLNDVIIPSTNVFVGNEQHLIRYMNQGSINYTSDLPAGFRIHENGVWQFGNTCFYFITSQVSSQYFYDVLVIPESGDTFFLGERLGFTGLSQIIQFKGSYFATGRDSEGVNQLIKVSPDLSQIEKKVYPENYLNFEMLTTSQDYLIAFERSGGNVSPPVWATKYYDENLSLISGLGGHFKWAPEIHPTAEGETIFYTDYNIYTGVRKYIITTSIDDLENGFEINGQVLEHVITNVSSPETYTLMRDLTSGIYSIHHLKQLPDMGSQSVGNWYNPDYQGQGMSVVEGLRDDGSRYLFVTLYLFRDGQPLWLAGVAEINYPQPEITLELAEYNGLGLWQADTPANVDKFADITLSMSACHQMMMHLVTVDNQTFNIELQRMVNNDINLRCKD